MANSLYPICKDHLRRNKGWHNLSNPQVAEKMAKKFGVKPNPNTIGNWRREMGCPAPLRKADNVEALYADPDFGLHTGLARVSHQVLGDRHDLARAAVANHMHKNNIRPHGNAQGGHARRQVGTFDLTSWGRPNGIDEHLEMLRG